jgi:hypothetical protein
MRCRLALFPCHAEGRGFESHHPLSQSPARRGFLYEGTVRSPLLPIAAHSIVEPHPMTKHAWVSRSVWENTQKHPVMPLLPVRRHTWVGSLRPQRV